MNNTNITAYALNELHGGEREIFESDLAVDRSLQGELASASRVADALAQIMTEPGEGLEPRAREKLLQAIAQNQKAFQQRQKIVRLAVPISLAAAASIAVLLWVTGGMTTQGPAVAAADGQGGVEDKTNPQAAIVSRGLSGGFTATLDPKKDDFTFRGNGELSRLSNSSDAGSEARFRVNGIRTSDAEGRTISMSESARVAQELREDAGLSLTSPAVRIKALIWDDDLTRWGSTGDQP
jgi:hypothetical protein